MPEIDGLMAIPALVTAVIGLLLLLLCIRRCRQGRLLRGGMHGLLASLAWSLAGLLLLTGTNLYTYQRLTMEQELARITLWQAQPQQYLALIELHGNAQEQSYMLFGDEWQIDARILKWTAPATLAGLDSRYRLERISGRYRELRQEREDRRSVYSLSAEPGLSIWPLLNKIQAYTGWVDAYYGNSTFLPMADQAQYQVVLTQAGILARPLNNAARDAISRWD